MRTEVKEVQIETPDGDTLYGSFSAVVRNGELHSIDTLKRRGLVIPSLSTIKAYIQFLQEVTQAMEE